MDILLKLYEVYKFLYDKKFGPGGEPKKVNNKFNIETQYDGKLKSWNNRILKCFNCDKLIFKKVINIDTRLLVVFCDKKCQLDYYYYY